jgi:hypothetical protein
MMLKTFAIAMLAISMSVGLAQAKGHMHKHMFLSACTPEGQASSICLCGTGANVKPVMCQPGEWCHAFANKCTK